MGLSIEFGHGFRVVNDGAEDCEYGVHWREHVRSFDGIEVGELAQETGIVNYVYNVDSTRSSSGIAYSSYNQWRNILSKATTGHQAEVHWEKLDDSVGFWKNGIRPENMPADPYDIPFMDIINFSDCEGVMGAKAVERLHNSFVDARTLVDELDNCSTRYQKFVNDVKAEYGANSTRAEHFIEFYNGVEAHIEWLMSKENPFINYS